MSKVRTEKRNASSRKLSLNRETLRTISAEGLEQVVSGWGSSGCSNPTDILRACLPQTA